MIPNSQACTARRQFFNNCMQIVFKIHYNLYNCTQFNISCITQTMKYIFRPGKIKETFYQANVVFGILFYDSVCSVDASLATNEIYYFCERQSPLDITQSRVLSATKA